MFITAIFCNETEPECAEFLVFIYICNCSQQWTYDGFCIVHKVNPRNLSSSTNRNRIIPSHTLLLKCHYSIRQSKTHLSRCKLQMTSTNTTCKWSLIIFRLHLPTHRTELILWVTQLHTHMVNWCSNSIPNHSNSIYRICPTMRTNIILRSNCNYKSPIRNSIRRRRGTSMSVRRFRSR